MGHLQDEQVATGGLQQRLQTLLKTSTMGERAYAFSGLQSFGTHKNTHTHSIVFLFRIL